MVKYKQIEKFREITQILNKKSYAFKMNIEQTMDRINRNRFEILMWIQI